MTWLLKRDESVWQARINKTFHGNHEGLLMTTALAFGVALVKFGFIMIFLNWYRTTPITRVATLETTTAFIFGLLALISLLPAHLAML